MAVDIHKLIAAIIPDVYCESEQRKQVKAIVREGQKNRDASLFLKAASVAVPRAANTIEVESLEQLNPFDLPGQRCPLERRRIVFDDLGARLEGLCFWLWDYMTHTEGWKITKVIDSLALSPGSEVYADSLQQTSTAQNQTMKTLEGAQRDVQSILGLVEEMRLLKRIFHKEMREEFTDRPDFIDVSACSEVLRVCLL